ncbi:putative Serine/threonine-protein phosphatase 2A regulatory subunit B'' subunit gamma [Paratrimastix pyriformis]|uniref:Serine/threonine-protein phosphatase 2A regulatory subunit B'' subunit gamma n=1 Tax=Paratrimastix pyriformis TaxID=342808 RepID=A0ABQ8UMK3_9EUKA|nr:putative Serine/threonine-protein phosphatase 2A regulatory subunit B'' subunit gamma [Paratrimastix pyriformis]
MEAATAAEEPKDDVAPVGRPTLDALFQKYYAKYSRAPPEDESFKRIPRFFKKKENSNPIHAMLRRGARARFLQRKSEEILTTEELDELYQALSNRATFDDQKIGRLNFDDFQAVGAKMPPKARAFFTATLFLQFERDEYGRINILNFFDYCMRKGTLLQAHIELSAYDVVGDGYLREQDMDVWVSNLIPTLAQLRGIDETFLPFYICTVVRKFFFFLDPMHRERIGIKKLILSPYLLELFELRDETVPETRLMSNWFSFQSTLRAYQDYLHLDIDQDGMLSREELQHFRADLDGSDCLTPVFVERVFQEFHTWGGLMDYKTFLTFILTVDYRKSHQSLRNYWLCLDMDHRGYITDDELSYFFNDIVRMMVARGEQPIPTKDVIVEIFDMIHPVNPDRITFDDLVKCRNGDTVVGMLTDLRAFLDYETRESRIQDPNAPEDQPGQ